MYILPGEETRCFTAQLPGASRGAARCPGRMGRYGERRLVEQHLPEGQPPLPPKTKTARKRKKSPKPTARRRERADEEQRKQNKRKPNPLSSHGGGGGIIYPSPKLSLAATLSAPDQPSLSPGPIGDPRGRAAPPAEHAHEEPGRGHGTRCNCAQLRGVPYPRPIPN